MSNSRGRVFDRHLNYRVLRCVAVCCSVLHCNLLNIVYCNYESLVENLQFTLSNSGGGSLSDISINYRVLQCGAVCFSVLHCNLLNLVYYDHTSLL